MRRLPKLLCQQAVSKMSALAGHQSSKVPREFIGLARLFRQSVQAESEQMCEHLTSATEPIRQRLTRKASLRPDHLIELRQAWATMPQQFRLESQFNGSHKRFRLNEARVFATEWHMQNWCGFEPGIIIQLSVLDWHTGILEYNTVPLALVGLHALGRWFERAGSDDTDNLLHDLKSLIHADGTVKRVPCGTGAWIGEPVVADRAAVCDQVIRIKTFVEQ